MLQRHLAALALSSLVAAACASNKASEAPGKSAAETAKPPAEDPIFADLKALEKQEGWEEMLGKLKEVAPAKRDAAWEGYAERAASKYLETVEIKAGYGAENVVLQADEFLKSFPTLKSSKLFLETRAKVGIKAFRMSASNYSHSGYGDEWLKKIDEFVAKDTVTADLPLRLAKEVVLQRLIGTQAFSLYETAFARSGAAVCADSELPKVIDSCLDYGVWTEKVTEIVTKTCWAQLKQPILERLAKRDNKKYVKHTCAMLAGVADAADVTKKACGK